MPAYMTGSFQVKAESIDRCKEAIHEYISYVQSQEPETRTLVSWQDSADPTRFTHHFCFEDEAAEQTHRTSKGLKRFTERITPDLASSGIEYRSYSQVAAAQHAGPMLPVEKNLLVTVPVEVAWAALTDPKILPKWMPGDAPTMDLRVGGSYTMYDATIVGKFTSIEAPYDLEYTWRQTAWPAEYADSIVRWELSPRGESTLMRLTHERFPTLNERDSHDDGWDEYWLLPLFEYLADPDSE